MTLDVRAQIELRAGETATFVLDRVEPGEMPVPCCDASVERIIRRLEELGKPAAAERLRVALLGSTSGEILGALSVELAALYRTPLRHDEQVGELLRDTRDSVDEALKPGIRRLRRLRRRLRLGG